MKPLPPVSTIEYHLTYSIITGEFYNNHNKNGRGGGLHSVAGSVHKQSGRRTIKIDGVPYLASRLAWKVVYGVDPQHEIDHIDNDRDNNSIINLRDVPHTINQLNRIDTKRNGGEFHYQRRARLQRERYNRGDNFYSRMTQEQKDEYNAKCKERRRRRRLKTLHEANKDKDLSM